MCIKKQMRVSPTRIGHRPRNMGQPNKAMRNATCHWENHRNPCANLVDFDCQFKLPEDDYKKRWTTTGFLSNGDVMCTQLFYGSRCCTEDNSCGFFVNASSSCILPKWFWPNSVTSWTLQSGRLENSGPEISRAGFPETRDSGRTCTDQPSGIIARCRGARRRAPNCCGTTCKSNGNRCSFCSVVLWREQDNYLGKLHA